MALEVLGGDGDLELTIFDDYDGACTADLGQHRYAVRVPDDATVAAGARLVVVRDDGEWLATVDL